MPRRTGATGRAAGPRAITARPDGEESHGDLKSGERGRPPPAGSQKETGGHELTRTGPGDPADRRHRLRRRRLLRLPVRLRAVEHAQEDPRQPQEGRGRQAGPPGRAGEAAGEAGALDEPKPAGRPGRGPAGVREVPQRAVQPPQDHQRPRDHAAGRGHQKQPYHRPQQGAHLHQAELRREGLRHHAQPRGDDGPVLQDGVDARDQEPVDPTADDHHYPSEAGRDGRAHDDRGADREWRRQAALPAAQLRPQAAGHRCCRRPLPAPPARPVGFGVAGAHFAG